MSDYNFLMETRLSPEQFQVINHMSRAAAALGLNLYLVGGAVRDLTYGQQIVRDLDFAVEGKPERVLRQLEAKPRAGAEAAPFQLNFEQHDSVLDSFDVAFTNGVVAEVSMARSEVYDRPGKRPSVEPATIFEDLRRRDFSVNAMAVSLHPNSRGLLLDPTNGAADIERRELRALHSRGFSEDPARIYRLLRLGLRLGFKPEERTETWLNNSLEYRTWERLDAEQQGRELRAILQEENPGRILKMLAERGLLAGLDRKLASARLSYDQFSKIRSVVQAVPGAEAFFLNFHCLVSRLGAAQKSRLATKIILDRKAAKVALGMESAAKKLARLLGGAKAGLPSQVFTLLDGQPQHLLLFLLAYYPQAKIQNRVRSFLFKFPVVRARMPRAELLTLGLEPGPKFEKIYHQLFLAQLDGKIKTHQQILKEFRSLAGIKEPAKPPEPKPAKPHPPKAEGAKAPTKVKPGKELPAKAAKPTRLTPAEPVRAALRKRAKVPRLG
jgi:tRNA nucleotidyltransferase/poly(A) polymerase